MRRRALTATIMAGGLAAVFPPGPSRSEPIGFRRGSWQTLQSGHGGHKTIVHFWGLTCGPCLVELPKWGQFRQMYPQANLVMVAADAMPQHPEALTETLNKAGLQGVESWWFQDRFSERLYWEVNREWQGELPFTVLLEPDGSSLTRLGVLGDFGILAAWLRETDHAP